MKRVLTPEQKAASNARVRAWKKAHPDRVKAARDKAKDYMREYNKEYRDKNRESLLVKAKEKYYRNRDADKEKRRAYYSANREAVLAKQREYSAKNSAAAVARASAWAKVNPEKVSASRAASLSLRRLRHPAWVDLSACKAFYTIAARVSACTGVKFEVDHIYPLRGKRSSGLHVPWNLRVVPKTVNRRKANKTIEEFGK